MSKLVNALGEKLINPGYDDLRVPAVRIIGPRLLVLPHKPSELQENGIIIPAEAQDSTQRGVVLVVGEGTLLADGSFLEPCVGVGDEIIYARYSGTSLQLEGQRTEYLIIQESDVRAVLSYRGKVFKYAEGEEPAVPAPRTRRPVP